MNRGSESGNDVSDGLVASGTTASSSAELRDVRNISQRLITVQAWLGAALLLLLPIFNVFHPTKFPWQATIHALCAISMVVLGSYLGHHAIYLLRGSKERIPIIRRLTYWCFGLSAVTVVSGNWAYMPYRGTGGAKERLMESAPFFHEVVMEFKEFICLLPFPLYAASAFIVWYYGAQVRTDSRISSAVGVMLLISWAFLIAAAVAGISLVKAQFL